MDRSNPPKILVINYLINHLISDSINISKNSYVDLGNNSLDNDNLINNVNNDLKHQGYVIHSVYGYNDAIKILDNSQIDLIILCVDESAEQSIEQNKPSLFTFLDKLVTDQRLKLIPAVALLNNQNITDTAYIQKLLESGINDYFTAPYLAPLFLHRVKYNLDVREKNRYIRKLLKTDSLTGLTNRKTFIKKVQQSLIDSNSVSSNILFIALFKLNDLKSINTLYGYKVGDSALCCVGDTLTDIFDSSGIVSRISDKVFAVSLINISLDMINQICKECIDKIENTEFILSEHTNHTKKSFYLSIQVGVTSGEYISEHDSSYEHNSSNIEKLINTAEQKIAKIEKGSNDYLIGCVPETNKMNDSENSELLPGINIEVGLSNVLNDESLFYEVLAMFYQDHGQDSNKLHSALIQHDILTAKHLSHTLKGVTGSIGAMVLYNSTKILDDAINSNNEDISTLMLYFNQVSAQLSIVLIGINKALESKESLK